MRLIVLLVTASCLTVAEAHVALWDKGMFGYNFPKQASDKDQNYNNNAPVTPLRQSDGLTVDQWFGHGYKSFPPVSGQFMDLPSGGTYNGEIQCNRAATKMGNPSDTTAKPQFACDNEGALHTTNRFGQSVNVKRFGGTALGIAYTSDVNRVKPNDMTIISVNYASPWNRQVAYQIPAGMPPCPSGGCICSWNWIHRAGNGEGYGYEIYNLLYRCRITGTTNSANVVQRGAVPLDCTTNAAACVKGPKTGLYIYQRDGNNLQFREIPPTYTNEWGFADGAQNDIFTKSSNPAGDANIINPYATGTGTVSYSDPPPTATAVPSGWKEAGCAADSNTRYLTTQAYSSDTNTISMCVSRCNSLGFDTAGLQGGKDCWCGSPTRAPVSAPGSECNSRCPGDIFAFCGGSWRLSLYAKQSGVEVAPTTTRASTTTRAVTTATATSRATTATTSPPASSSAVAAAPSASIPSGWTSLGCHGEKTGPRMFNADRLENRQMTAAVCIAYCSGKGYKYAGTQYSTQCYCGASFTPNPVTGCTSTCAGDSKQICGGAYKNTVYAHSSIAKRSLGHLDEEEEEADEAWKYVTVDQEGPIEYVLEPRAVYEHEPLATQPDHDTPDVDERHGSLRRSEDDGWGPVEPLPEWNPVYTHQHDAPAPRDAYDFALRRRSDEYIDDEYPHHESSTGSFGTSEASDGCLLSDGSDPYLDPPSDQEQGPIEPIPEWNPVFGYQQSDAAPGDPYSFALHRRDDLDLEAQQPTEHIPETDSWTPADPASTIADAGNKERTWVKVKRHLERRRSRPHSRDFDRMN